MMATLTSDEKAYIRANTGNSTVPTDDYLQYIHDNQADSDLDTTVYFALLAVRADLAKKAASSNSRTGDSQSRNQGFDHLDTMIKSWGIRTGAGIPSVTIGTINLGIDEEDDTFDIT